MEKSRDFLNVWKVLVRIAGTRLNQKIRFLALTSTRRADTGTGTANNNEGRYEQEAYHFVDRYRPSTAASGKPYEKRINASNLQYFRAKSLTTNQSLMRYLQGKSSIQSANVFNPAWQQKKSFPSSESSAEMLPELATEPQMREQSSITISDYWNSIQPLRNFSPEWKTEK
jgi:hypothetical protein